MIVFVVAFGSIWPVLLGSIHGFRALDPRLAEAARMLRFSPLRQALKFRLPNVLPDIFAGIVVLGALGFLTSFALQRLETWLLRWRPAQIGG